MGLFEILLIIFCVIFVSFVIIKSIVDRKNGKPCSNCSECQYSNQCLKNKNVSKKEH